MAGPASGSPTSSRPGSTPDSSFGASGIWRGQSWLPLLPPAAFLALVLPFLDVDPARGVTFSNSPFTDEAYYAINARNLVLLGRLSTDDWNLHLLTLPYTALQSAAFGLLGVGILQARLVAVLLTAGTSLLVAAGLRRSLGAGPAVVGAFAFAGSALVLYYGRLAYAEMLVALLLTGGCLLVLRMEDRRAGRWGFLAGCLLALAIGTKTNAAFGVAGLLVGATVGGGLRPSAPRRWLTGALGAIALFALGWVGAIGLPMRWELETLRRILAEQTLPTGPTDLAARLARFAASNDGMLGLAGPLLLAGLAGALAMAIAWRRLPVGSRALAGGALGWALAAIGVLLFLSYRPNRYLLQALPALAILTAVGLSVMAIELRRRRSDPDRSTSSAGRLGGGANVAVGLLAITALTAPGVFAHAGWIASGTRELMPLLDRASDLIPAGTAVQGEYAPLLGFVVPSVTVVSRPATGVNPGDLYATRGVRWIADEREDVPEWAALHPAAWASRQEMACFSWGRDGRPVCMVQLP